MPEALMTVLQYASSHVNAQDGLDSSIVEQAYDEVATLLEVPKRYVSVLPDGTIIGWDTCGKCIKHVKSCTCKEPTPPLHVSKMIERETLAAKQAATDVHSTQISKKSLPQKSGSASTGKAVVQNGTLVCNTCKSSVAPGYGDESDDGTFMCHKCQENS